MDSILLCDSDKLETTVDLCSERGFGVEFQLLPWPKLDDDRSPIERRKHIVDRVRVRSLHGPFADLTSCSTMDTFPERAGATAGFAAPGLSGESSFGNAPLGLTSTWRTCSSGSQHCSRT